MVPREIAISVVIPVHDEVENLPRLLPRLVDALEAIGREWEIIVVDDGSEDGSFEFASSFARRDPGVTVIQFARRYGQTSALMAGFDAARGAIVVPLDGDFQNDPADIARLVEALDRGYDVASGWRRNRRDPFLTRILPSRAANALIGRILDLPLHDFGCTLKAYRREVVKSISLYGEMHRFIPAFARQVGARVVEVEVGHHARAAGRSKYSLGRFRKVVVDLMVVKFLIAFSTAPFRLFGTAALASWLLAAVWFAGATVAAGISPSAISAWLPAILLGVQGTFLFAAGFLGELVIRVYYEAQGKRPYSVRRVISGVSARSGRIERVPEADARIPA